MNTAQANITEDGSFTHAIPLQTPRAVNGMAPQLALSFDSQAGNGVCGIGCNLAGFGAIYRTEQDKGIHFGDADHYAGPNGLLVDVSGSRTLFRTKHRTGAKYEPAGSCGLAAEPCSWTETLPNGTKKFYGATNDSRIEALGRSGAVRVWALSRVEDLQGNGYDIQYLEDGTGAFYPQVVLYDSSRIEFQWQDRLDYTPQYQGGGMVSQTKLLSKILVKTAGQLERSYRLLYEISADTDRNRLIAFMEMASDDQHILKTQRLDWQDQTSQGAPNVTPFGQLTPDPNLLADPNMQLRTGDFNGDGKTDFVVTDSKLSVHLYTANASGGFTDAGVISFFTGMTSIGTAPMKLHVLDFDGSGTDDIILQGSSDAAATDVQAQTWFLSGNAAGGFHPITEISRSSAHTNHASRMNLPQGSFFHQSVTFDFDDLNGDGHKDIVLFSSITGGAVSDFQVYDRYQFDQCWMRYVPPPGALSKNYQLVSFDLDDNGSTDRILQPYFATDAAFMETSHVMTLGDGSPIPANADRRTVQIFNRPFWQDITYKWGTNPNLWAAQNYQIMHLDLNRDGKLDIIFRPTQVTRMVYMMLNNGDGFDNVQEISARWGLTEAIWAADQYDIARLDLEGDGRTDLIFSSKTTAKPSYILKGAVSGYFEDAVVLNGQYGVAANDWSSANNRLVVADFNGDQLSDLMLVGNTKDSARVIYAATGKRDALVAVRNGLGGTTRVKYQLRSNHPGAISTAASPTAPSSKPNRGPTYLAVEEATDNGRGLTSTKRYQYLNGRYISGNRLTARNLGFEQVVETQVETGAQQVKRFMQDTLLPPVPVKTEQFDETGQLMARSTRTWQQVIYPDGTESMLVLKELNERFEGGQLEVSQETTSTYDAYEYPLTQQVCTNGDCAVTTNTYQHDPTQWVFGELVTSQTTHGGLLLSASRNSYQNHLPTQQEAYFCPQAETCAMGQGSWKILKQVEYDAKGRPVKVTDALGRASTVTYDPQFPALPSVSTNALGHQQKMNYDALGRLASQVDANGNRTEYAYDLYGRPLEKRLADGGLTRYSYSSLGDPTGQYKQQSTLFSRAGEPQVFSTQTEYFDGLGNSYKTIHLGDDSAPIYQLKENQVTLGKVTQKTSLPYSEGSTIQWSQSVVDLRGRPVMQIQPDGTSQSYVYSPLETQVQLPNGQVQKNLKDPWGRTVQLTEPNGKVTLYTYDPAGRVTLVDLPGGNRVQQFYDGFGRVRQMTDPTIGTSTYQYDLAGNLLQSTDSQGRTTTQVFDALNRMVLKRSPGGSEFKLTFDDAAVAGGTGRLTQVDGPGRIVELGYDKRGQVTLQSIQLKALPGIRFVSEVVYDLAGRVREKKLPQFGPFPRSVQTFAYSEGGNLTKIGLNGNVLAEYGGFDAAGRVGRVTFQPSTNRAVHSTYSYNAKGLPETAQASDALSNKILDLRYQYNATGHKTAIQDLSGTQLPDYMAATGFDTSQTFAYDNLGRLTQASGAYGQQAFGYDDRTNLNFASGQNANSYQYNGDRLVSGAGLSLTYDGYGNLTRKVQNALTWDYGYNDLNQLISVQKDGTLVQEMAYDMAGIRYLKKLYDPAGALAYTQYDPVPELRIRYQPSGTIQVTKQLTGPGGKQLASFDETFSSAHLAQGGQWAAYANRFDDHTLTGFFFAAAYRGLGFLSQPKVAQRLPAAAVALLCLLLLVLWFRLWKLDPNFAESQFNPWQRGMAMGLVFVVMWVASCNNNSSYSDTTPFTETPGDAPSTISDETVTVESAAAAPTGGTVTTADGSASVGNWAFFHSDPVQSTSLVTDGAGKLAAQINHLPYGEVDAAHSVGSAEALKQWASYTGQEQDPETGLIYYKFRYYDPSLRRFISPDNMVPGGGRDPQAFNRYAYVLGNPVDFNDPD
ncbi:MAG: RHS repeat-associated core domain-containing protein, partial [bacterium]|nr:RHS repeat-associated core domain-containing protein [bacterium]